MFVDGSAVVITGRVVEILYAEPITHENLTRRIGTRVAIIENLKGADGMTEIILAPDDINCGGPLTIGDTYLFFIPPSASGQLRISECGTFLYATSQEPGPDYMGSIAKRIEIVLSILRRTR